MTDQSPPGHGLRAQLARGPGASPIVSRKRQTRGAQQEGLDGFSIPRGETRRGDHRERDRHRLDREQAVVGFKSRKHDVELINLSGGGAMVSGKINAKLWDMVDLQLGPGGAIECAVRWIRDDRYGLEFAHETRLDCTPADRRELLREVIHRSFPEVELVLDQPTAPSGNQNEIARQDRRHPLIWTATIHHNFEWEQVRLRNISTGGALIDCAMALVEGMTVFLEIGTAGRFGAIVCWKRGDQAGLAFTEPFDLRCLSSAQPTLASEDWELPDYLKDAASDSSPWAARWNRLTLKELGRSLFR